MITVNAIECPTCHDIIFSRAHHDFHYCTCGETFIDGGFDYTRYGGKDLSLIQHHELEIDATEQELYDDWNKRVNKYGTIQKPA
jgi:hypothetical protein